jgi:hypothetical protein
MLFVSGRIRIMAGRHRVRISPFAVSTLDADLAASKVAYSAFRCGLSFALGRVYAAGALAAGGLNSPPLGMLCYVSIWHFALLSV